MGLQAALEDEVPIGAVLVLDGKVLARAHNKVEAYKDPTAHAEMLVIREVTASCACDHWTCVNVCLSISISPSGCVGCGTAAGAVVLAGCHSVCDTGTLCHVRWSRPGISCGCGSIWSQKLTTWGRRELDKALPLL